MASDASKISWIVAILLMVSVAGAAQDVRVSPAARADLQAAVQLRRAAIGHLECAPGDLVEGEPVCQDEYVDQFNSGCGGTPPVFQPVACALTICGTSGTFLQGGAETWDTDWFELAHAGGDLYFTATAELPIRILLLDAVSGDCWEYVVLDWSDADPYEQASISLPAAPLGLYWLWVGPSEHTGWPCGCVYRATVTCARACPADLDGSGDVGFGDLLQLLSSWGPCPDCPADLDGDMEVGFDDLLLVLAAWGVCP